MIIGRIGGVSPDGKTVLYDANTQEMVSLPLPILEAGLEIEKDANDDWHVVIKPEMYAVPERGENETEASYQQRVNIQKMKVDSYLEMDRFYYATRAFLPYKDYEYVARKFPYDCYQRFKANPFYLADIQKYNEETPICSVSAIDKNIVLPTFESRKNEMKYVIRHVLTRQESMGNTWMTLKVLERNVKAMLTRDGHPLFTGSVYPYVRYFDQEFVIAKLNGEKIVGLASSYDREKTIYHHISRATAMHTPFPKFNVKKTEEMTASDNQVKAVNRLLTKGGRFSILTGGPGTGKTTTLKLIVSELTKQYPGVNVHLLSPTGRAAKRIQEVFGEMDVKVSTVHRFIGFGANTLNGKILQTINAADLIIVDESSMLDLEIFKRLISLINFKRTKVILVGDVDQLPSIGAGNVLHDLIALGVHTERLTENFRSNGPVIRNGMRINSGNPVLEWTDDFQLRPYPKCVSDYFAGMNEENDIVITPYRKESRTGNTGNVNLVAQSRIFEGMQHDGKFMIGDVVIMMETNYKNGYYNGETGRLITHFANGDWLVSFEEGRSAIVTREKDMDLGYAGTVHKCQGSEYDVITIDIPEYNKFITRRMLYTAVTRAKSKVIIHSTKEILRRVIMNNPEETRNTWLGIFEPLMILD